MSQEILEAPEGRAFFIVLAFLAGVGVMMAAASLGILAVAVLSF